MTHGSYFDVITFPRVLAIGVASILLAHVAFVAEMPLLGVAYAGVAVGCMSVAAFV